MRRFFIIIVIIMGVLSLLAIAFMIKTHSNYNDPDYQVYKDEYIKCMFSADRLSPDAQIYKAWKNNEPINCR